MDFCIYDSRLPIFKDPFVRFKDGVKVQAGDTQLGKVVQMLGDARKVPAKIIGIGHLSLFVGQIDRKISPVGAPYMWPAENI